MTCRNCTNDMYGKSRERYCSLKCKIMHGITKEESGCWIWNHDPKLRFQMRYYIAYRACYEIYKGHLPASTMIRICRRRECINPDHLELPPTSIPVEKSLIRKIKEYCGAFAQKAKNYITERN